VSVRLLVGAKEFWLAFGEDARGATSRCYAQMLTFEADEAGRGLVDLLLALPSTVDRRLIVDDYSHYVHNDRFLYRPSSIVDGALWREARATFALVRSLADHGVGVHWTNRIYGRLHRLAACNHKKILVVDDRVAYIGGINFSDHNFGWHDLMVRIDDPELVACLAEDCLETFAGRNQCFTRTFRDGQLTLLDGKRNPEQFRPMFEQIASAREDVFVIAPYASAPFFDPLEAAARRGVRVMILTPAANNWSLYDGYIRIECFRRGFELYHMPVRMLHMKAMLIDSRQLIVGSSNFDYFSYHLFQELLFVTTDDGLVRDFRERIRDKDFALARREHLTDDFSWQTRWAWNKVRTGFPVIAWFNRRI